MENTQLAIWLLTILMFASGIVLSLGVVALAKGRRKTGFAAVIAAVIGMIVFFVNLSRYLVLAAFLAI